MSTLQIKTVLRHDGDVVTANIQCPWTGELVTVATVSSTAFDEYDGVADNFNDLIVTIMTIMAGLAKQAGMKPTGVELVQISKEG